MAVITEVSKGGNVKYYINAEEGVVTARIESDTFEVYDIAIAIADKLQSSDVDNAPYCISDFTGFKRYCLKPYYVGTAKCSNGDRFNAAFGKKLALARAQKKYHAALSKRMSDMAEYSRLLASKFDARARIENDIAAECQKAL